MASAARWLETHNRQTQDLRYPASSACSILFPGAVAWPLTLFLSLSPSRLYRKNFPDNCSLSWGTLIVLHTCISSRDDTLSITWFPGTLCHSSLDCELWEVSALWLTVLVPATSAGRLLCRRPSPGLFWTKGWVVSYSWTATEASVLWLTVKALEPSTPAFFHIWFKHKVCLST